MTGPDREVRAGQVWRHWKEGTYYFVVAVARHSETLEEMVVYRRTNDSDEFWARPVNMWLDEARPGEKRFRRVR